MCRHVFDGRLVRVVHALVTLLALLGAAGGASAQTRAERELALAVAKVAVNEAGFRAPADVALVWQVTEAHGSTTSARLGWLRAHSARVLGDRECTGGNCIWTRGLTWGDDEPEGWPETWPPWRLYRARWAQVRAYALALVQGRVAARPCAETPDTWGGEMDHQGAIDRGMRRCGCVGTLNQGYRRIDGNPS
jgi:hypothetical protein